MAWPRIQIGDLILGSKGKTTHQRTLLKQYLAEGDTPERRKEFIYNTFKNISSKHGVPL